MPYIWPSHLNYLLLTAVLFIPVALFPFYRHAITIKRDLRKGYVNEPQTFGDLVRNRRIELKMSQQQMATFFGLELSSVRKWEWGLVSKPCPANRAKIIEFLGVEPECLKPKPKQKVTIKQSTLAL